MEELIQKALSASTESAEIDFKRSLNVDKKSDWLEVIKDIVAMANSGGGIILFGIEDDGTPNGIDCAPIIAFDSARIGDKIFKLTKCHFAGFTLVAVTKGGHKMAAIRVEPCAVPLVFACNGQHLNDRGEEKVAFRQGTVYFRHGAKSEPGTSEDLAAFLDREVQQVKSSWLGGIRQVVEAPLGSQIQMVMPAEKNVAQITSVRVVPDGYGEPCKVMNPDQLFPFRQTEVVREVNERFAGGCVVNRSTIQDVRKAHRTDQRRDFYYKGTFGSSQFSQAFVDWIVEEFGKDKKFFKKARIARRKLYSEAVVRRREKMLAGSAEPARVL